MRVEWDDKDVVQQLGSMARKAPVVLRNAVNDTAFELRQEHVKLIANRFPTAKPQTKKNIFVKKATSGNMVAIIFFDQIYGKDLDQYMKANIDGGRRQMKPSEQRLGSFYVPGRGAKLDRYGNMQGGQVTQILSRLGRFGDVAGYNMNQTAASKKRLASQRKRTGKKATEYFVITKQTGGLKPGIYQRTASGKSVGRNVAARLGAGAYQRGRTNGSQFSVVRGRGATPVMVFVKKKPSYKAVWPFYKTSTALVDRRMPQIVEHYVRQILGGR